jgi:hypothetical protein
LHECKSGRAQPIGTDARKIGRRTLFVGIDQKHVVAPSYHSFDCQIDCQSCLSDTSFGLGENDNH